MKRFRCWDWLQLFSILLLTNVWHEAVGMVACLDVTCPLALFCTFFVWHHPIKVYTLECALGKGHFVTNNKMATCLLCVIHSLNGVPCSK